MSDEPVPEVQPDSRKSKRQVTQYSDEDKEIALATVDLCAGNVFRAALACNIPRKTLEGWVKSRDEELDLNLAARLDKRRGDLATKMEYILHSALDSMLAKLPKATFSQTAVGIGILTDKIRLLRGQGLEPDPATELCKLLGINRTELPERLELGPGEELPSGFGFAGPVIEAEFEPVHSEPTYHPHAQNCPFPSNPANPDLCSCGAHALNEQEERNSLNPNRTDISAKSTEDRSRTPPEDVTDGDAKLLEGIDDDDSAN